MDSKFVYILGSNLLLQKIYPVLFSEVFLVSKNKRDPNVRSNVIQCVTFIMSFHNSIMVMTAKAHDYIDLHICK